MSLNLSSLPTYTVGQVNEYIRDLMEDDLLLQSILVRGEISNYKRYPSGHHYFSLKDETGVLKCVMFRGEAAHLRFRPENGMRVVAFGHISVFPRDGAYQLYCADLLPDGRGPLDEAFERLRRRLEAEGLFDEDHKTPLPKYPRRIALVTSPVGKAVRDMIRVLGQRWPLAEVLVVPVRVQGEGAAEEIAAAIHSINNRADIDLVITGRGGGSMEELWAFNEEIVARAIYVSNIPVISAVGHEPDVTIADYAADLRASTPSNAAELAVPDRAEQGERLADLNYRLCMSIRGRLEDSRRELDRLRSSRALGGLAAPIQERRMLTDSLRRRLAAAFDGQMKDRRAALSRWAAGLDALSPLKVLGRGYAIAGRGETVVSSIRQAEIGDRLDVAVSDGVIRCEVREKEERSWR